MSLLEQGCTCASCSKKTLERLQEARDRWEKGEREIVMEPYHHKCGDGCCEDYGTNVHVNGFNLNCDGDDIESVLASLMEFLNIENVEILRSEEDEEERDD